MWWLYDIEFDVEVVFNRYENEIYGLLILLMKNLLARVPLAVSGLNVITSPQDRSSANVIEMEIIHSVQATRIN